ncbi:MAG: hypothetical protein LBE56_04400 [Tannerella sp.]|nr:hypothetical protein [Tannerella sp.]
MADKEQIRQQCIRQEQKLNKEYAYFQENAGSLLISGLSSLVFSGFGESKKHQKAVDSGQNLAAKTPAVPLGLSDYLKVGKMMIPTIWEIAQPVIIAWGIRKIKSFFTGRGKG